MYREYLRIAYRNLSRSKLYSLINIFGLAIGITVFIILSLFIADEVSFDRFHKNAQNTYRVIEQRRLPDNSWAIVPLSTGAFSGYMHDQLPEIKNSVRIIGRNSTGRFTIQYLDNKFYSGSHIFTEPSFFQVFDFKLLAGDENKVLAEPNSVVLTESEAYRLFGNKNPINSIISVERFGDCRITGVIKDLPINSHLQFNIIFSLSTLTNNPSWREWIENWRSDGILNYVVAKDRTVITSLEATLNSAAQYNFPEEDKGKRIIKLQKLTDIHFYSQNYEFDYLNSGAIDIYYVYLFGAVAAFILIIACINFMNLSSASSLNRLKEIGIRKVLGAQKLSLIKQFLTESFLFTLISIGLAVISIELLIPLCNKYFNKNFSLNYIDDWEYAAGLFILSIIVSVSGGLYPALVVARFDPARIFKGSLTSSGKGKAYISNFLVIIQFSLSIIMIISTIIAYKQLLFVQNKNLGFNKNNIVVIDINSSTSRSNFKAIKAEFEKYTGVTSTSVTSRVPGDWKMITQVNAVPEGTNKETPVSFYFIAADNEFLDVYNIKIKEGRNFRSDGISDSGKILINESAAKMLGWENSTGKKISIPESGFEGELIGIVKDFHFQSLHERIAPLIISSWNNPVESIDYYSVKINAAAAGPVLSHLRSVHEQFDSITPFEFNFLDDRLNDFYLSDQRLRNLFIAASIISIIIACLGLFALSAQTIEKRIKEIGIRKVLGATTISIVLLAVKQFLMRVLLANVIAWPVAYLFAVRWLEDYFYRIELEPTVFLLAGILSITIAFLTISYHVIKSALINPVKSLKYE